MTPPLFSLALLYAASRLVDAQRRPEWLAEWKGELWAVSAARRSAAFRFILGSFSDAWYLRRHCASTLPAIMESPAACLALLASAAVFAAIVFPRIVNGAPQIVSASPNLVFAATIAMSAGLLNCVWSWDIAIPTGLRSTRHLCVRWYMFLAAKFSAVLVAAHQATVHLVVHGLPPQAVLIGCIAAFLWIQREQRKRCPVCLHRLARPVRVGTYAQTFLGWNGTEAICLKGHGALYIDCETTGRASRAEWTGMDATWADLFLPHSSRPQL